MLKEKISFSLVESNYKFKLKIRIRLEANKCENGKNCLDLESKTLDIL